MNLINSFTQGVNQALLEPARAGSQFFPPFYRSHRHAADFLLRNLPATAMPATFYAKKSVPQPGEAFFSSKNCWHSRENNFLRQNVGTTAGGTIFPSEKSSAQPGERVFAPKYRCHGRGTEFWAGICDVFQGILQNGGFSSGPAMKYQLGTTNACDLACPSCVMTPPLPPTSPIT